MYIFGIKTKIFKLQVYRIGMLTQLRQISKKRIYEIMLHLLKFDVEVTVKKKNVGKMEKFIYYGSKNE